LPAAGELLAIPRQRLDSVTASLPRALKANTHAHFRRFAAASARLTVRVLRGQLTQARHRLIVAGERMTHSGRALLAKRRDRFAGLSIRLKASKLSNAQAQRQNIARDRERVMRLAERARRALLTATQRLQARVANNGQLLGALSYRAVLARGFALVRDELGHAIHTAAGVGPSSRLDLEFSDGRVAATSDANRPPAKSATKVVSSEPKAAVPKRAVKPAGQGSLF